MFYEVLVSKIFRKTAGEDSGILTYSSDQKLAPGQIVTVPLGRATVPAIVYRRVSQPDGNFKIKPISSTLYGTPLPSHLLKSLFWISKYYLTPLPQVVSLALPSGITKSRRVAKAPAGETAPSSSAVPLNSAQKTALQSLRAPGTSNTKLLHGVTGSGKTNIYLTLAKETFARGQSTILLVPEIALTSQLVQIFQSTFGSSVILIHSKQTEAERHKTWELLLNSTTPRIVVGPRSALFAPLSDLGLIIIDEAHESSYFQEQPPKYSALRLASFIAKTKDIPCIYGTATPLVADYYLATKNNAYIPLTEKAKPTAFTPEISIVDFKNRSNFSKNRYFSNLLLAKISENLERGHQTLIFHNRRGSAPLTICESCGWQALCPECFLPLTLHTDSFSLVCHTCGHTEKVPASCPECHHLAIIHKGFGTKLLESELKKLFKTAHIARFDTDNTKSESLSSLYDDVKNGDIDIIIGTQTIARGFDFPSLATVGIIQADAGLSLPDYSAEERTFHLLTQVLGRVGRGHLDTANAVIQTYQPDHPVITSAIRGDYNSFTDYLLKKRSSSHFPPYFFLARLWVNYKTEATTLAKIKQIHRTLSKNNKLILSSPTPAFHERTKNGYSWQITLKSRSRAELLRAIAPLVSVPNLHFVIDPPSLL